MKIAILAGEHSGDLLGAALIRSLRKKNPTIEFTGIGGPAMIAEGFTTLYDIDRIAVMGLIEPLFHLHDLFKIRRELVNYFSKHKPDIFIGIDAPDFNLGLEIKLRAQGIKTVHYVSPSVWAWRKNRVFKIKRAVDLMLTLFPFEERFYQDHKIPVQCVGHPLADQIPLTADKIAARQQLHLPTQETIIALMPGSRRNELKLLGKLFIKTALRCWQHNPQLRFISSAVNEKRAEELRQHQQNIAPNLPLQIFIGQSHPVLAAADVVLVTAGTATLETLLFKRPMVIAYRMGFLTHQIAQLLVKIPHIGLPNLLANELLVPEFLQNDARSENLAKALMDYVNHPEKIKQLENQFTTLHQSLSRNAGDSAADAVFRLLN